MFFFKLQLSVGKTVETSGKTGGKCKKSKISSTCTEKSPTLIQTSTETSKDCTPLPDFNNFQVKTLDSPELAPKEILQTAQKPSSGQISRSNSNESDVYDINQIANEPELKPNIAGKLPLPRLPNPRTKQALAPPKTVLLATKSKLRYPQKYKHIQPKPSTKCDTFYTQEGNQTQVDSSDITPIADELKDIDYFTRERLISVSNVDKDALDDYLHGGNNSQEQEEELMQYFKNNSEEGHQQQQSSIGNPEDEHSNGSKSDKLSQLRLLLEQNLNPPAQLLKEQHLNTFIKADKQFPSLPTNTLVSSSTKRRVSFETSVLEETVPPSPNTRRKNFSFTPISPGPHSPGRQSKSSSTNASPFVSPRNTPVPRAKSTHTSSAPSFVVQQNIMSVRKHLKPSLKSYKQDTEIFDHADKTDRIKPFIQSLDINAKCNLPMSAPPSPMLPYKQKTATQNSNLLQKLLDSNSKVTYTPDYEKSLPNNSLSQEVSQLMSTNQGFTSSNSFRSQSVPLHQMASNIMSPCISSSQQFHFNFDNNSVPPTPANTEFSDFEPFPDTDLLNNGLNNENLNQILNILDTTQNNQLDIQDNVQSDNVFNYTNTNILPAEMTSFNQFQNDVMQQSTLNKPMRSQSIDEISVGNISQQKFSQLSRSVPSTPLPYKTKLDKHMELNINNNQLLGDMYDVSKTLTEEQDFLLNGTPVVKKKFSFDAEDVLNENNTFPQSLGFIMNENVNNEGKLCFGNKAGENFNARRNLNTLLEQQFEESDEFTTVPN